MVRGGALQLRLWITRATSIGLGRYSERHTSACMTQAGDSAMLMSWALRTGLWTVVVMLAVLSNVGVNITAFIASLGVGGIAVALAVQNILGTWFASLSIAVDQPFEVGVSYRTTPEQAEAIAQIARRLVRTDDTLRFGRAPFQGFSDSALDYGVVYTVKGPDYNAYMDAQQTLNLQLMRELAALGVEFASPTRTVHLVPGNNVGPVVDADAADPVALHAQVRPALT